MMFALALMTMTLGAGACTPEQIQELTRATEAPYALACQATLPNGQTITRPLVLEGEQASGAGLDCQGGAVGRAGVPVSATAPTIAIRSVQQAHGAWSAPSDVTLRNCTIFGAVRIWGVGSDGRYDALRASSRTLNHTAFVQQAAPRDIRLDGLTIVANGTIPLYIGPGVTGVRLTGSTLTGQSVATALYLDAESGHNVIENNRIHTRTRRELVAVDGSAFNTIRNNHFELNRRAGILLYRNCGERGIIRHQTPSHNTITGNVFAKASWLRPRWVVQNARNGRRSYCGDDAGYPFGSSVDDRDGASGNTITDNRRA